MGDLEFRVASFEVGGFGVQASVDTGIILVEFVQSECLILLSASGGPALPPNG